MIKTTKYSWQRELIRATVLQSHIHPSADVIYSILKPDNPNLSLGTVYRNLNKLADDGSIGKLRGPNGSDRFDGNIDKHNHVICKNCGDIHDVTSSVLNDDVMVNLIREKLDMKLEGLILNVICNKCENL